MLDEIVQLTKKLIEIKTTPDNKEALSKSLEVALAPLKDFTIEHFEDKGVKSVLIYNTPKRLRKFKIILNGHLDIIPGKEFQYTPVVKGNRLYGVGVMDMKASVASLIILFRNIAKTLSYPIALQLVTDEEYGSFSGTKYQVDQGVRGDFIIAGETTNFNIENKTKGVLWIKVKSKGKTAHGAYPWKGKNAIWEMMNFLTVLEKKYPIPTKESWTTAFNLAKIETTNTTYNKIPDNCEVMLDIRYIPEEIDTIVKDIKKLLPSGFNLEIIMKEPAQFVEDNNAYIKKLQLAGKAFYKKGISLYSAQGSSDARHYTRVGCDAVEFGPLGKGMGTDNEWVDIKSLKTYYQILEKFLLSIG